MSDTRAAELSMRYLDDDLSPSEHTELRDLLASTPAARAVFIALTMTGELVHESLNDRAAVPVPIAPARTASAGRTNPRRIAPYAWSIAAAVLLTAAAVAAYVFAISDPQPEAKNPQSTVPLATLIHASDDATVIVDGDIANPGDDYRSGVYSIESGVAEFMLANAVNVKLRGNTRMVMRNPMNVALNRGSAEFTCPQGTSGFTVHLPGGGRIVDLGTAFRVWFDESNRVRTEVTVGAVRVDVQGGSLILNAGEAAFIEGTTVATVAPESRDRLLARIIKDPTLISFSPMDVVGNAPGRYEDDQSLRPHDRAVRLERSQPVASFTLAAWVNLDSLDGLRALLITESDGPGRVHWQIDAERRITLGANPADGEPPNRSRVQLDDTHLRRWLHLAVVVDADTSTVGFYLNGEPSDRYALILNGEFDLSGAVLGDSKRWRNRRLDGRLDDFLVLGRAMSDDEIRQLFRANRSPSLTRQIANPHPLFTETDDKTEDRARLEPARTRALSKKDLSSTPQETEQ